MIVEREGLDGESTDGLGPKESRQGIWARRARGLCRGERERRSRRAFWEGCTALALGLWAMETRRWVMVLKRLLRWRFRRADYWVR